MNNLSPDLFSSALDLSHGPTLLVHAPDLTIIAANKAALHFTGYTREDLLASSLQRLLPELKDLGIQLASIAGQDRCHLEESLRLPDGTLTGVSLEFRSIPGDGNLFFFLTIRKKQPRPQVNPVYLPDSRFPLMPLLANAPVCLAVFEGPQHLILSTNRFNLLLAGKQDIVGKTAMEAFPEEENAEFLRLLDYVYRTGKSHFSIEKLIQVSSLSAGVYMNLLHQPFLNASGVVDGVLFFGMDVTEQVKARKKIEESERRYRQIVETAQEGIWTIDEHNVINFVNSKMCEIMECGAEDIIGRTVFDFMDDEGRKIAEPLILKEASLSSFDFRFITRRGRPIWTSVSVNPIYDGARQYRGALAMITDITDRRQAELLAHKSEERFRNLIEHNADVIVMADADWNVFYETPSRERMTGFTPEDRIGRDRLSFIHPDDRAEVVSVMEQVRQNPGVYFPWRHRKLHKDGHYIWIEGTIINMLHDDSVQAMFTNYRDVTEKKLAEEALLEKNEQLRSLSAHLQEVREEERAAIAREIHDQLGQQLTSLKMEASWIYKKLQAGDGNLPEKIAGILRQIDDTINTVRRISTDLRPPILDDFGLAEAIEWQAAEFEQRTGISCHLTSTLEGDITDQHVALTLFRVFQETLTNVARHSGASEIHAHLGCDEGQLALTITDNGIGISEGFLKQKRTLGLLGMKERIAMVNGRFSISKNGEKGTVTRVTVPYDMKQAKTEESHA